MAGIVPSRLYRVKIFESYEVFKNEEDGWARVVAESDDILEHQIAAWVSEEKVLVVTTGPVNIIDRGSVFEPAKPGEDRLCLTRRETRTVSVIYAPPVAQGDYLHGEQPRTTARPVPKVPRDTGRSDTWSDRRISDADLIR